MRPAWLALALFAATAALFAPTLFFAYLPTDDVAMVLRPEILGGPTLANLWSELHSLEVGHWIPLTGLSLQLGCLLGAGPAPQHALNLLIHAANAALLFWLLRGWTGRAGSSAVAAAAFAWHPARIQSVAWIAERKDVLSAAFLLLLLLFHSRRYGRPYHLTGCALLLLCALLSKPMAMVAPLLLLLVDRAALRRTEPLGKLLTEKLSLFAIAGFGGVIAVSSQGEAGALIQENSLAQRAANGCFALLRYLQLTLWPSRLAFHHPFRPLAPFQTAVAVAGVGLAAIVVWRLRGRTPVLLPAALWALVSLVPVLGLVQVGISLAYAERYLYLPHLGVAWMVAALLPEKRSAWVVAAACAVALAAATAHDLGIYRDGRTLFADSLAREPDDGEVEASLAEISLPDQPRQALAAASAALSHRRRDHRVHRLFGTALASNGRTAQAIGVLTAAVKEAPDDPIALRALLDCELPGTDAAALLARLDAAPAEVADDPGLHALRGVLLLRSGHRAESLPLLREGLDLSVQDPQGWLEFGDALVQAGDPAAAATLFVRALWLMPDSAAAREGLARASAAMGRSTP